MGLVAQYFEAERAALLLAEFVLGEHFYPVDADWQGARKLILPYMR